MFARWSWLLVLVIAQNSWASSNDELFEKLLDNTDEFETIVEIDHARLAAEAGVTTMSASRVLIFNNPKVTTRLLQLDPMLGLEMPYRVLAYEEDGVSALAFTDNSFLRARHELSSEVNLDDYSNDLLRSYRGIGIEKLKPVSGSNVSPGYGITSIESQYGFQQTLENVKKAIMAQGDTVWFGTVDYSKDAAALSVQLSPSTLLLFGGPAPGGLAMTNFPRLGLDAFCQKILVLEDASGDVNLYFNDIVALSELHYGSSNKPQAVINQRLNATLKGAVTRPVD